MKRKLEQDGNNSQNEEAMDIEERSSEEKEVLDDSPVDERPLKRRRIEVELPPALAESLSVLQAPANNKLRYDFLSKLLSPDLYHAMVDKELMAAVYAAKADKIDYSKITSLLEVGADINTRDNDGDTPLATAINRTNLKLIKFLLDKGANPKRPRIITHNDGYYYEYSAINLLFEKLERFNGHDTIMPRSVAIDIIKILSAYPKGMTFNNQDNNYDKKQNLLITFLEDQENPIASFISSLSQDKLDEVLERVFQGRNEYSTREQALTLLLLSGARIIEPTDYMLMTDYAAERLKLKQSAYTALGFRNRCVNEAKRPYSWSTPEIQTIFSDEDFALAFDTVTTESEKYYVLKKEFRIDWKEEFEKIFDRMLAQTQLLDKFSLPIVNDLGRPVLVAHKAATNVGQVLAKTTFEKDIYLTAEPLALVREYLSPKDTVAVLSTARHSNIDNQTYSIRDIHDEARSIMIDSAESIFAEKLSKFYNTFSEVQEEQRVEQLRQIDLLQEKWKQEKLEQQKREALEMQRRDKLKIDYAQAQNLAQHSSFALTQFKATFTPEQQSYWEQFNDAKADKSDRDKAEQQLVASLNPDQTKQWGQMLQLKQQHAHKLYLVYLSNLTASFTPAQQEHWKQFSDTKADSDNRIKAKQQLIDILRPNQKKQWDEVAQLSMQAAPAQQPAQTTTTQPTLGHWTQQNPPQNQQKQDDGHKR
jgi:ankyrin repeat protein